MTGLPVRSVGGRFAIRVWIGALLLAWLAPSVAQASSRQGDDDPPVLENDDPDAKPESTSFFDLWLHEAKKVVEEQALKYARKEAIVRLEGEEKPPRDLVERLNRVDGIEKPVEHLIDRLAKAEDLREAVNGVRRGEPSPWKVPDSLFISKAAEGVERTIRNLRPLHVETSWKDEIQPRSVGIDDIERADPEFLKELDGSLRFLLKTASRYERLQRRVEENLKVVEAYRQGLRTYQISLERIFEQLDAAPEFLFWEWWAADQIGLRLADLRSILERFQTETKTAAREVSSTYSVRSKLLDAARRQSAHKRRLENLDERRNQLEADDARAVQTIEADRRQAQRVAAEMNEADQARARSDASASRPYVCPYSGVDFATCTNPSHRQAKDNYLALRNLNLELARAAAQRSGQSRAQLDQIQGEVDRLERSRLAHEAEREAVQNGLEREENDYQREIGVIVDSVRDLTTAEEVEVERLRRDEAERSSRDEAMQSRIHNEAVARFFRRLSQARSRSATKANPFDNTPQSKTRQGNPFDAPSRPNGTPNPFDAPERPLGGQNPFDPPATKSDTSVNTRD